MSKRNKLLLLLLSLHVLKGIATDILVPLWEFPDEQAHFAQVSYQVETGFPINSQRNLSTEIYESERVLGTLRDKFGNNSFTYHPQHQHQFSTSFVGLDETYLNHLPNYTRNTYPRAEAARGEPLFYTLTSLGYLLNYHQDLISRVNASRLISVILSALTVYIAFCIGLVLVPPHPIFALVLATLTSFHPMFSFVSSGINSDNLINLIGALLLFISLKIIASGLTTKNSLLGGAIIGIGILSKPLILPLTPGFVIALLFEWYQNKRSLRQQLMLLLPLILVGIAAGGWKMLLPILETRHIPYLPLLGPNSPPNPISLTNYIRMSVSLHYRQTLVWYWGVFKWLGVILPLPVVRTVKLFILVSFIGLIKAFITKPKLLTRYQLSFLIFYSLSFVVTLSLWDWLLIRSIGFSQGLQGRYFFTTLIAHLSLLLVGFVNLVPSRFTPSALKLSALLMVALHAISFEIIVTTYYNLSTWSNFWHQLSQYKPQFYKYPLNLTWFLVYFGILLLFLIKLTNIPTRKAES